MRDIECDMFVSEAVFTPSVIVVTNFDSLDHSSTICILALVSMPILTLMFDVNGEIKDNVLFQAST